VPFVATVFAVCLALIPGQPEDNQYGAWTAPSGSEKGFAVVGIVLMLFSFNENVKLTRNWQ